MKKMLKKAIGLRGLVVVLIALMLVRAFRYWPEVQQTLAGTETNLMPVYHVAREEKKISLTFEAGGSAEGLEQILEALRTENIKAVFFVAGAWAEAYPEAVKKIAEEGHEIGNHSVSHKEMGLMGEEKIEEEVMPLHKKIRELTGQEMTLFRPPYGNYSRLLVTKLKEMGYQCIEYDVDSQDWKDYGSRWLVKQVCNHENLRSGSILRFHIGAASTAEALPVILQGLKAQGYELVPLRTLLWDEPYEIDREGTMRPSSR